MPVWHDTTRQLVRQGKLAVLGVTQEQHPERCALFAQWKQFDWPILHDPINVLQSSAVPVIIAVDEYGIVRAIRPNPASIVADFIDRSFANDAAGESAPVRFGPVYPPVFSVLREAAENSRSSADYRTLGDALALWGSPETLDEAIAAYSAAAEADPTDGPARFRLGVVLRRRYESASRQDHDFQQAVANWGQALQIDPSQYIWRRRIQQYGPRLDKPYPFYDWVRDAERDIRERGEQPVSLPVRPDGAEIAAPLKGFSAAPSAPPPDSDGRVPRIEPGLVATEVTVVPRTATAGQSVRVHLIFRIGAVAKSVHWNNEAEPLRLWLDAPSGWELSEQLLLAPVPPEPVSTEDRRFEFEVRIPRGVSDSESIRGYALFHVCDDAGGSCRFVRLDVAAQIPVTR